jgi:hypothetical protein
MCSCDVIDDQRQSSCDNGNRGGVLMTTAEQVRQVLASTRRDFHALVDALPERALREPSTNPAWTNGEILFHMAFGFFLLPVLLPLVRLFGRLPKGWSKRFADFLNAGTSLFNIINAWGPHVGGRVMSRHVLVKVFDRVYRRTLRIINTIPEAEWQRGMYFPWKWDGLFQDYMTLAQICTYPSRHFLAHREQLRLGPYQPSDEVR